MLKNWSKGRLTRGTPRAAVIGPAVVAVLLLVAGACSNSDSSTDPPPSTEPSQQESGWPVTIEHRFGSTEVVEQPRRIVSLDVQWTDSLLALGTVPVGYLADYNLEEGFPWRGDGLADSTAMTATTALPFEQIAALDPDLIVVTYFAQDQGDYDTLSAIAPTITTLSDNQVDTWQDITRAAGRVMAISDRAEQVIRDVDDQVAAVAEELPGLEGKTFAFANYVEGDKIYVVSDPEDGANVLFAQLGLEIAPAILEEGEGVSGRVEVSLERVDLLDADLLALFTNGADPESIPGYAQLPAVQNDSAVILDYAGATALNTPTPLSVPYSLEILRPALEATAAS